MVCMLFDPILICQVPQATLPFMAKRLVMAYTKETPVLPTAVDDLESFVWVLVWTLVC